MKIDYDGDLLFVEPQTVNENSDIERLHFLKEKNDKYYTYWPFLKNIVDVFPNAQITKTSIPLLESSFNRHKAIIKIGEGDTSSSTVNNLYKDIDTVFKKDDVRAPYNFQKTGIVFLYLSRKSVLADDVGLGKTIQALGSILLHIKKGNVSKGIIICPSSIKYQWRN